MQKRERETYVYYGVAIVVCLLLIVGLIHILKNDGNRREQTDIKQIKGNGKTQEKKAEEPQENPNIRVLIMTTGYAGTIHPQVTFSSESGMVLAYNGQEEKIEAEQELVITPDDVRLQGSVIRLVPSDVNGEIQIRSVQRGYGTPSYKGAIEVHPTAEGVAIINELLLEQYLCKVVPSEMPTSYESEALKAQAVCARSYAYRQMTEYGYPEYEAHVNDSTDYQVYGNSLPQESSNQAIEATKGKVLKYEDQIAVTYYYSTSSGKTTSLEAWGSTAAAEVGYLQSVEVAGAQGVYEKKLPWYRWTASISSQTLSNLVGLNTGVDVGSLQQVEVTKRGPGEIALQIVATGDKGSATVDTENKIRSALGGSGYSITKNDGTIVDSMKLLPSAFITIEKVGDKFVIKGGGFGHGIGMSQNGANEMAKQGNEYKEILSLFYPGTSVE